MEYNPMAPSVEKEMRVTRDKLASFVGSGKVEVLATPMVVMLMEKLALAPAAAVTVTSFG